MTPVDNMDKRYVAVQIAAGFTLIAALAVTMALIENRVACILAVYVEFVVISTLGDVYAAKDEPTSQVAARKMTMNAVLGVPACLLALPFIH